MKALTWKSLVHQAFKLAQKTEGFSWQKMFEDLLAPNDSDAELMLQQPTLFLQQRLTQTNHHFSSAFVEFIQLVIQKKCSKHISKIYRLMAQLLFLCKHSLVVTVETAQQLKQALKTSIEAKIMSHYGISSILIKYQVLKELLGGIRICTPLGIMDHSMKYKLKMMSLKDNK